MVNVLSDGQIEKATQSILNGCELQIPHRLEGRCNKDAEDAHP
jgi:hypothetical protein